ncbi:MAG: hypothetical protein AB1705_20105 [Verrucomicrobiota bacterium]
MRRGYRPGSDACAYHAGLKLTEKALKELGFEPTEHFEFFLLIDPDYEQTTHVAILSRAGVCLHEWANAWEFHFASLKSLKAMQGNAGGRRDLKEESDLGLAGNTPSLRVKNL